MNTEHIIIVDREGLRLSASARMLGEYFGHKHVVTHDWEAKTAVNILSAVEKQCAKLHELGISPLVMSNIDGFKYGILRRALEITRHQMHGVLATCWNTDKIATLTEAKKIRYRWACLCRTISHLQFPIQDGVSEYAILRSHMKSLPKSNPFRIPEE